RTTGNVKDGAVPAPHRAVNLQALSAERDRKDVREQQMREKLRLEELKRRVEQTIDAKPRLAELKSQIRLDMTRDGLRIQIVDEQNRPMFDSGSSVVRP